MFLYKVTKIWKYFYFDLLRFNFSCCVFRVRNSLEFKYNPQKCLIGLGLGGLELGLGLGLGLIKSVLSLTQSLI